jgi:hypothetical protein
VPYSDTIVSYLDVLGFTELVKASERDPTAIERITNILEATERKTTTWLKTCWLGVSKHHIGIRPTGCLPLTACGLAQTGANSLSG